MKEEILNHQPRRLVKSKISIIDRQIEDLDVFEKKIVAWPCKE